MVLPYARLLRSWDEQQTHYIPGRERRFEAMFDLVSEFAPRRFVAWDLGCGPGSLTQRLLRRFPGAQVVAMDHDPVLLEIGRGGLAPQGDRILWLDHDLREGVAGLPPDVPRPHAVVSTTALHWLDALELGRLYRDVRRVLRPGGIFLNGDPVTLDDEAPRLEAALGDLRHARRALSERAAPREITWEGWWRGLARYPELAPLLEERRRRYPNADHHGHHRSASWQRRALHRAGFAEAVVAWAELNDALLAAVPGPRARKA